MSSRNLGKMIRVALIGAGVVAEKKHIPALVGVDEIEVVAIVDPDLERAQRLCSRFPNARPQASLTQCLESIALDAAVVLTPPRAHVPLAREALDAGKFVLVEKPLCLDLEEAQSLQSHPFSSRVLMGFHMRHHRLIQQARALLQEGALGQIQGCRAAWFAPRPPDQSDWKNLRAEGGGALIELPVHYYDLLRFLFGSELEEIRAESISAERDDETACVLGRTTCGIPFSGVFSERASYQLEFEIYGSQGRLKLNCLRFDGFEATRWGENSATLGYRLKRLLHAFKQLPHGVANLHLGGDYILSYREQWRHFAALVRGECAPLCRVEDGTAALRAALSSVPPMGY